MRTTFSSSRLKMAIRLRRQLALTALLGFGPLIVSCSDSNPTDSGDDNLLWDLPECDFNGAYLFDGGIGFDGIPSISDPVMVEPEPDLLELSYLENTHRVMGILVDGQPMAVPLSALWYHEVLNLNWAGVQLVVTHAALTGSSRVYLRNAAGGSEFGVSGLLYRNNLVLYDRSESPSLWVQLSGEGRCGSRSGANLSLYPFVEVTWAGWKTLHPNTLVLSEESADARAWGPYPYGNYETSPDFFFPDAMPTLDPRLPAKDRVLAIREGVEAGVAFPLGAFQEGGEVGVASGDVDGEGVVVFWRGDLEGAAAFWAEADGQALTFKEQGGQILDEQTGTTWSFLGTGSGGGLDGFQLEPVKEAAVAYWGAWAAFYPDTEIR